MPDRGKERDGTDGIVLPSNLLLRREQTAATHGRAGDTAAATPPSLTCSRGALPRPLPRGLGSLAGSWGSNRRAEAGRTKAGWKRGFTTLPAPGC